jgi:hypothetical protein
MGELKNYSAQEAQCRLRALADEQHKDLWLSMAERWACLARNQESGQNPFVRTASSSKNRAYGPVKLPI